MRYRPPARLLPFIHPSFSSHSIAQSNLRKAEIRRPQKSTHIHNHTIYHEVLQKRYLVSVGKNKRIKAEPWRGSAFG